MRTKDAEKRRKAKASQSMKRRKNKIVDDGVDVDGDEKNDEKSLELFSAWRHLSSSVFISVSFSLDFNRIVVTLRWRQSFHFFSEYSALGTTAFARFASSALGSITRNRTVRNGHFSRGKWKSERRNDEWKKKCFQFVSSEWFFFSMPSIVVFAIHCLCTTVRHVMLRCSLWAER